MNSNMIQPPAPTRSRGPLVCSLASALNAASVDGVGGKATNLAEMAKLGMDVPPGFVVTDSAFQLFLDENKLLGPIGKAIESLEAKQLERINAASKAINGLVLAAKIPEPVLAAILAFVSEAFPDDALAVRSSAIGEDSRHASFAGQLDSFLNVKSEKHLIEAVLGCWASYWSPRVLFYQLSKGICLRGMGVVIQKLVSSQISGILFTANPDLAVGKRDSLVVEYCRGFGDELAAGKLNPGRMVIDRSDFSYRDQATPEQAGGEEDANLFTTDQMKRLSRAALKLEQHFGCPQDIEWTIDQNGQLFLVQTRPITVGFTAPDVSDKAPQEAHPVGPFVLWSNANVNENFPEPISPFLYSIASAGYYHYFRNLALTLGFDPRRVAMMEYPLRNVIGVHGARMYYNLTNIHSSLRMAPCGELLAKWFDDFVGVSKSASANDATLLKVPSAGRLAQWIEWLRTVSQTTWQLLFLTKRVAAFERVVHEFAATTKPSLLESKSLNDLLQDLRAFIDIRCNRWTNASLADATAMVTYGMLKRLLSREFPDREQSGLHNSLLKGLRDVVSGTPIIELWKLSRMVQENPSLNDLLNANNDARFLAEICVKPEYSTFHAAFQSFLQDWGFRCSGELMLTVASFQEQPEALLDILRSYVALKGESPLDLLNRQAADRESETYAVMQQLRRRRLFWVLPWPSQATWLSIVLKSCHKSIALRERARLKQALVYNRCRRIALAIADKLVAIDGLQNRNDIFFLTYEEVDSLLVGSAMFPYLTKELVQLRKDEHQRLSRMTPDDSFVLPPGCYLPVDGPAVRVAMNTEVQVDEKSLLGIGACGGKVTGPATILRDISECRMLHQGDVLVTRQTDPGWGPVFFLIQGLVMERGGMLSHGAILAREYGIPTVVGVRDATKQILTGQRITVNGDRGIVQLLD
jgi:rifampicin phosphotransferase